MRLSISLVFQILSLFITIFYYIKKRNNLILYFIPFLFLTVTIELIGRWYVSMGIQNYAMYNFFTTLEFIFYSFLFYLHFQNALFKRISLLFIPFFLSVVLINMVFIQGFGKTFNTYTFL